MSVDPGRLNLLRKYRGCSLTKLSLAAADGNTKDLIGRFLRGETLDIKSETLLAAARYLRVPYDAFLSELDPHAGESFGWHELPCDHPRVNEITVEMADSACITAVSDDMNSYLLPAPVARTFKCDLFPGWGIQGEDFQRVLDYEMRFADRRLELREGKQYVHYVIGPTDVPLRALKVDPDLEAWWLPTMKRFNTRTAVGFVRRTLWPSFRNRLQAALPHFFQGWRKINIASDKFNVPIVAGVWAGQWCWYTYHFPRLRQLFGAIRQATATYLHEAFPIHDNPLQAPIRRWYELQSLSAYHNILNGVPDDEVYLGYRKRSRG